jgi:hypothetical protein
MRRTVIYWAVRAALAEIGAIWRQQNAKRS